MLAQLPEESDVVFQVVSMQVHRVGVDLARVFYFAGRHADGDVR